MRLPPSETPVARRHYDDVAGASTLAGCAREFAGHPGPRLIAAVAAGTIAARMRMGRLRAADLGVAAGVMLVHPVAEWAVHVFVLHRRRVAADGRIKESFSARTHRQHHEDPKDVDLVLLPVSVTAGLVGGAVAAAASAPDRRRGATGAVVGLLSLLAYEWVHFLIHAPYQPRGGWYRSRWRAHRLHHYRNEHYWYGVVSTAADKMLRTAPERDDVPVSTTALTLVEH
ncbi:MAG TPA: sterol desaturase family protein [Mycobacteriales bacterium]|nr:sterol desaturase family protein [Mycobacteriales bacterium]